MENKQTETYKSLDIALEEILEEQKELSSQIAKCFNSIVGKKDKLVEFQIKKKQIGR